MSVFTDINVRLPEVDSNDNFLIEDTKAVVQSIYRLFNTEEGEIPYFRAYGLNIKQYSQKPLTQTLAEDINEHVKSKLALYEQRAALVGTPFCDVDFNAQRIILTYTIQVISTGQVVTLAPLSAYIG